MSMSLAELIAPHLPYLRRYARALTGSQKQGDTYVATVLETIVADPKNLRSDLVPRVALYHAFVNVWSAMPLNHSVETVEPGSDIADRRIESITPLARQAFLLAAVEEFSIMEIAVILDLSTTEVKALVDTAGREIAEQIASRVLIIEDEPLIALDIENLVSDIGHQVAGIARTRREAAALAARENPGLILADIQLADGSSGIDAVNDILAKINVPVIFITAYPERLLTGERLEPIFLITKPFKPEMVKAIISQALFFDIKARAAVA